MKSRTELTELNLRMNANWYTRNNLDEYVIPLAGFTESDDFVLMHAHTARQVIKDPEAIEIEGLDWSLISRDVNFVEHVWNIIKQ